MRITDTAGKTVVRIDEAFPDYQRLVQLVQSHIDAKPDDTSLRIMARKARRTGLLCFVLGCCFIAGAVFLSLETHREQRARELLAARGVPGEAEIVRRFFAPNGVTKRVEYRIAGSQLKNVEVEPAYWDQLAEARTVSVVYVPEEPDVNRLEAGEVNEAGFTKTPLGGYLVSALMGLLALFVLGVSPFAWLGYDLAFDDKGRFWKLKRYGRVIWTSQKPPLAETQTPRNPPDARDDAEL